MSNSFSRPLDVRREDVVSTNVFDVGDKIDFILSTGEDVTAVAIKKDGRSVLFVLEECLRTPYRRYELDEKLNTEILASFPEEICSRMMEFEDGSYLRLLRRSEVLGARSIAYFDIPKHRVAGLGSCCDRANWWWLENKSNAALFEAVTSDGLGNCMYVSNTYGCRPVFKLRSDDM